MSRPEPTLGNPKNTIEILQKYKFVFQKKFGQNFLIDEHVLEKIIHLRSGIAPSRTSKVFSPADLSLRNFPGTHVFLNAFLAMHFSTILRFCQGAGRKFFPSVFHNTPSGSP